MINFAKPEKELIVITTETRWDEAPRMRHYVANQLSRHYNVLYCELYTKGLPQSRYINGSLIVRRVGYYVSGVSRFDFLRGLYNSLQASLVVSASKEYNKPSNFILNFRFDFWNIFKSNFFKKKYFFLNDDFVNMDPNDSPAGRNQKQRDLDKTVSMSDRVFASSEPLANDVQQIAKAVSVIYSGHDFTVKYLLEKKNNVKDKIEVCVMGFINFNLEFDWLIELSKTNKANINLIGPVQNENIKTELKPFPNIRFYPSRTGKDLQEFLIGQDVLLMPYTSSLINTKASVPAKLFQYLACGKPVVSSLMPDLITLPAGFVYQAENKEQFVDRVFKAYESDSVSLSNERMKFAEEHTWDRRGDELMEIINTDKKV